MPASTRAGRPSNTDATALPTHGGHPITIVVADDTSFVEHLGNAGRPHAAADRPITSLHRPSGSSRSFVLASLRALHLDQHLRSGAVRAQRALTGAPHTGNAGSGAVPESRSGVVPRGGPRLVTGGSQTTTDSPGPVSTNGAAQPAASSGNLDGVGRRRTRPPDCIGLRIRRLGVRVPPSALKKSRSRRYGGLADRRSCWLVRVRS